VGRHRLNDLAALALGQRNGRKPRIIGAVTRSDNKRRLSRETAKAVTPSPRGSLRKDADLENVLRSRLRPPEQQLRENAKAS